MKKLFAVLGIVALLSLPVGCGGRIKAWFCKVDIPAAEATLTGAAAKIQGDYAYWVGVRDELMMAVQKDSTNIKAGMRLGDVLRYLQLADQFLAVGLGVLEDVQKWVCAPAAVADAEAKANEALAVKPAP